MFKVGLISKYDVGWRATTAVLHEPAQLSFPNLSLESSSLLCVIILTRLYYTEPWSFLASNCGNGK